MGLFICLFYKLLAWLTGWLMDLTIVWFRLSIVLVPGFFCLIVFTYLNGFLLNWVASMLVVVYVIAAHYQWLCGCLLRPTPNCWHYYQQHFSVARLALSLQLSRGNCVPGAETRARARTLYSDPCTACALYDWCPLHWSVHHTAATTMTTGLPRASTLD